MSMSVFGNMVFFLLTIHRACENASSGEADKLDLAKKAIIQKGRDNTRIPFPVSFDPRKT